MDARYTDNGLGGETGPVDEFISLVYGAAHPNVAFLLDGFGVTRAEIRAELARRLGGRALAAALAVRP